MIDKDTYIFDLQVSDIYYFIHKLAAKEAVYIKNEDLLEYELNNILIDYIE